VIVTHSDQAPAHQLTAVESQVRKYHSTVPIYRAIHAHSCLRSPEDQTARPLDDLRGRSWFAVAGIADPQTFIRQLQSIGGRCASYRAFADHHPYTEADVAAVRRDALAAGADLILTTEKDWAKIQSLPTARGLNPPIWRVDMTVRFLGDGEEERLWEQVWRAIPAGSG
jgi:tetraacyldisaccharide 4'-kinase